MYRKAVLALTVVSLLPATGAAAQSSLRGEIISDRPIRFQDLSVEMQTGPQPPERTQVNPDGVFEFRNLESGSYRLRVCNLHGEPIREEIVVVSQNFETVTIRIRGAGMSQPVSGSVSLRRLSHKPPKDARKAWKDALKAAEKGDHETARAHLERSVALDPEYFEAQYSLGGERIMAGDANGALESYDKALEIDPSSPAALVSRGMVLLHFRKADRAVADARKALVLGGDSAPAHYLLGLSLAVTGRNLEEALEHLKISAPRFAQAKKAVEMLESELTRRSFVQK